MRQPIATMLFQLDLEPAIRTAVKLESSHVPGLIALSVAEPVS